jgi:predicted GNAT family acetyltransferase
MNPMNGPIRHDVARRRFEIEVDGHRCDLDYSLDGTMMTITHTGVPDAVGGRGIAADLVATAFAAARANGWKVRPACSYAAAWARKHPEFTDIIG